MLFFASAEAIVLFRRNLYSSAGCVMAACWLLDIQQQVNLVLLTCVAIVPLPVQVRDLQPADCCGAERAAHDRSDC